MTGFTCTTDPLSAAAVTLSADVAGPRLIDFCTDTGTPTATPADEADRSPKPPETEPEPAVAVSHRRVFDPVDRLARTLLPFGRSYRAGLLAVAWLTTGDGLEEVISQPSQPEVAVVAAADEPLAAVSREEAEPPVVVTHTAIRPAVYAGIAKLVRSQFTLSEQAFVVGGVADPSARSRFDLAIGKRAGLAQVQVIGGILNSCGVGSSLTNGGLRLSEADYNRIGRSEVTRCGRPLGVSNGQVYSDVRFATLEEYRASRRPAAVGVFVG